MLPKIDPRMEVDDELGMEGWPRGAPSRGVVALRRVCGLLMMDPCRQDKKKIKVIACLSVCASAAGQEAPHLQLQQQNEFDCLISLGKEK